MKRRHPRQITVHTDLRTGDEYALIRTTFSADSPQQSFISCARMRFVAALDNGEMHSAEDALDCNPAIDEETRLTTHDIHGETVVAVWRHNGALEFSHPFSCYAGDRQADWRSESGPSHQFFVPLADWDADPRVYVIDWINPNDVCEAGLTWAEEESKLRRRRDAAMRRTLGFE